MNEREIFQAAVELTDVTDRREYLDQACGGNPQLRQSLETLLRAHDDAGSFLEHSPAPRPADAGSQSSQDDPTIAITATSRPPASDPVLTFLLPTSHPGSLGRLGQYEVLGIIGRGGMGVVLKAHDTKLNRTVAVKVLSTELAATPEARKRFLREAHSAAAVVHPHVVTIHAVEQEPVSYLVMEMIDGQSLAEKLHACGALSVKEILRIGSQIAAGLAAAHKQGMIHRDIKPANILLENGVERVKITDFGLARAGDDIAITRTGEIAGTPQYMSPEQAQGEPLDYRSDIFSLGSVLYTMCTGRPAFRAESTVAVLRRVCDETPRPIREVNAEIPDWLAEIVEKLMAKKPDDRFQSAREVGDLLGEHLAELQQPTGQRIKSFRPLPRSASEAQPLMVPRGVRWPLIAATALWGVPLLIFMALELAGITHLLGGRANNLSAPPPPQTALARAVASTQQQELQGKWVATAGERNGGEALPEEQLSQLQLAFKGNQVAVSMPGGMSDTGTFELDPSQSPHRIRVTRSEGTNRFAIMDGIYELDGERLRICMGEPEEKVTEFKSRAGTRILLVNLLRRERADGTLILPANPIAKSDGSEWTPLFNGKDLTGWETGERQHWSVRDGILVGRGTRGYLHTTQADFQDFHLRAEVRLQAAGNSGVFFRTSFVDQQRQQRNGYEADINLSPKPPLTGSLTKYPSRNWLLQSESRSLLRPAVWSTMEIIAKGKRLVVKVDGVTTADVEDADHQQGHIGLQLSKDAATEVEFRKIEIQELAAEVAPASTASKDATDTETLQGEWKLMSVMALNMEVTFSGDKFELKWLPKGPAGEKAPAPDLEKLHITGVVHLDQTAQPRRITVLDPQDESKRLVGIFRLEGETLFLCYRANPKDDNSPTKFATNPIEGTTLAVLKKFVPQPDAIE